MPCWSKLVGTAVLSAGLLILGPTACARRASVPALELQQATAEQLTRLLHERYHAIQTMKGLFRVQIQGPGIPLAQRLEGALYYRRPDILRLQGFNRVGGELFEFILQPHVYRLRLPNGQHASGQPAELEHIGVLAGPFRLSVLAMSGVLGTAPIEATDRVTMSEEGERYRLDVIVPAGEAASGAVLRRIWFDRRLLQVVREDRVVNGELEASAQFDDFRSVPVPVGCRAVPVGSTNGAPAMLKPFRIAAQDARGRGAVTITFHELIANGPLTPSELAGMGRPAQPGEPREGACS